MRSQTSHLMSSSLVTKTWSTLPRFTALGRFFILRLIDGENSSCVAQMMTVTTEEKAYISDRFCFALIYIVATCNII